MYPTATHCSTGGGLTAATLRVADGAVSSRLTEPQVAGQVGLCLLLAGIREAEKTVEMRTGCLAKTCRRHDG